MQEDNIAIRLKSLISDLGINSSIFADNCGISRATLSQLLTGRNKKISDVLVGQIHKAYPTLSILWLLFNEGDMWLGESENKNSDNLTNLNPDPTSENGVDSFDDVRTDTGKSYPDFNGRSHTDTQKNACENINFLADSHAMKKNGKENGLNVLDSTSQNPTLQAVNTYVNNANLINEIENLRAKIKKVVQITIYYDDSTFESFFPK